MQPKEHEKCVSTVCYMCYGCCGIKVKLVDGKAVHICGDPDNPHNLGRLCAKGKAGVMSLYDPYRVKTPLIRTNPNKGIGIDPKWKEISWEEALNIITEKLKRIREEDPRKLVVAGLDFHMSFIAMAFASAFRTPNIWRGGADYFCGNGLHPVLYLTSAAFFAEPDFDYCNYCVLFGTQMGFMVNTNATTLAKKMADARARGMKVVVIDPVGNQAAAKADRWIAIRPGTDAALALGLVSLLINDLGVCDTLFLKKHTNGPYLIGPDQLYIREKESGKPLVWDLAAEKAKAYDDLGVKEPALEGNFLVDGVACQPAFQRVKEHVRKYNLDEVSKITSIPAHEIRRLAEEFGAAARVGSKIVIEGKELPYRPVAVAWNRGPIAHRHGMLAGLAIQLLNMVVGSLDVPGGLMGCNPVGPFWGPQIGPDGLIIPADVHLIVEPAYPARPATIPDTLELGELFPVASYSSPMFEEAMLWPEKYSLSYRPEVMLIVHSNVMLSTGRPERMAQVLKNIPYIISFAIQLDETVELADLVLPDAHYLERLVAFPNRPNEYLPVGEGVWFWVLAQPAGKPAYEARPWHEVFLDIAGRLGITRDLNTIINTLRKLKEPCSLDVNKQYKWEEIVDIWAKSWFGPEHDLAWFKQNSLLITAPKKVEEAFPRPFLKARIPVYFEHFVKAGPDVKRVAEQMGIPWDVSDYQPIPDWKPCPAFHQDVSEFDLYAVNYKLPFHTFSSTAQNPWLDELAEHHPFAYKIAIHSDVAEKKGIKEGDPVLVESSVGKVEGVAKLTQCIHPEVVAMAGTFGHWAKAMPIARGKGAHFNSLLPWEQEKIDTVSAALDSCVRVKISKIE